MSDKDAREEALFSSVATLILGIIGGLLCYFGYKYAIMWLSILGLVFVAIALVTSLGSGLVPIVASVAIVILYVIFGKKMCEHGWLKDITFLKEVIAGKFGFYYIVSLGIVVCFMLCVTSAFKLIELAQMKIDDNQNNRK